jgi:hypothetical protein
MDRDLTNIVDATEALRDGSATVGAVRAANGLDELPFDYDTPATVNVSTKRCRRHAWTPVLDDRHVWTCARCGQIRDETARRRNRNNRQRGSKFELTVAKQLGGRKTGPLGGRDDVMVGQFAAIQTKKTLRLSLTEARAYLADLRRTFPDRVPLVVHALPGHNADPIVILPLDVWRDLHGKDGTE